MQSFSRLMQGKHFQIWG